MRVPLLFLALASLFVVGARFLDEQRATWGALPVRAYATTATLSPETSGLAVDSRRETLWIAGGRQDARWSVTFDEPVELVGISIDTGLNKRMGAKEYRVRLTGPEGHVRTLTRRDHESVFACWHVYRRPTPFATSSVQLRVLARGRRESSPWALRNVRFLVDGRVELPVDGGQSALRASLLDGLLPFSLGALWLVFLLWPGTVERMPA